MVVAEPPVILLAMYSLEVSANKVNDLGEKLSEHSLDATDKSAVVNDKVRRSR
jgi:hypothetical protein